MMSKVGLISGNGKLPLVIAEEVRKRGFDLYVSAITGETDPLLKERVAMLEWAKLGELGRVAKFFKRNEVSEVVMAGKITKTNLFHGDIKPDLEMIKVLASRRDHSDDSLLGGIADYLESKGIHLLATTTFLTEEALPKAGALTKRRPSSGEMKDIEFGWKLAKEMGRLDIGQTVVVKRQAILAVEAIEGTDEAIRRGGTLGKERTVVVKVAKPNQDMRFDVPTVGLGTLDAMIAVESNVLAFEAEKTIVVERDAFVEKANKHQISVLAVAV